MRSWIRGVLLSMTMAAAWPSLAVSYPLPEDGGRLIGVPQGHTVAPGEHLAPIAERYGVGLIALMELNPGVDPFLPKPGTKLKLPTYMLLPDVPYSGVVINLAELRLYHFERDQVHVYPIGIGRIGHDTPLGVTRVTQKTPDPTWTPTASTRAEYLAKGIELPTVVPAGPDNPLGKFALRLGFDKGQYLIHGTNKDFGVGLRVSAGCIRLWPADIEALFSQVARGERVRVINQPVKVATGAQGEVMVEVHSPLTSKDGQRQSLQLSVEQLRVVEQNHVNQEWVTRALVEQSGVPKVVGWP